MRAGGSLFTAEKSANKLLRVGLETTRGSPHWTSQEPHRSGPTPRAAAGDPQQRKRAAMQEIIHCPSCQRKLQVPESLVGQDVQCPTCSATFTASMGGPAPVAPPAPPPAAAEEKPYYDVDREAPRRREPDRRSRDDYDVDYDDRPRRPRRRDLLPHRGSTVLTLGILSLVLCGPVLGPIAWIMGNQDMIEIRAGRMDPEGESPTNAGRICGMIATILGIIGLVIGCLWIFAAINLAGRGGRF